MSKAPFTVELAGEALRVELFGLLDEAGAVGLEKALQAALADVKPRSLSALVIMEGLSDCAEAARAVLVRVQRQLGQAARRTAWVDNRSRFRGMALWVMHLAEDQNAKAVATVELADRWLASSELREADAMRRTMGA